MRRARCLISVTLAILGALVLPAIAPAAAQTASLQERVAALKESLVKSQMLLKQYEWIETRVLSLKGEEKNKTENRCYYGADGKLQKVPVGTPPEEKKMRGLRGKIVEKKKEELTEYMQSAMELIKSYVPPDPERIEVAKNAGKVAIIPAGSSLRLDIHDYEKPGDTLTFELDMEKNTLLGLKVATWLKDAQDAITMTTRFGTLDDGATYPAEIILLAPAQSLEVKTSNSGYRKI